jgi:hypothetical protein
LRLTTANTNQHGSAWFDLKQPLATGFTTAFQFQVSKTNSCFGCSFPADGLALVIQNDPSGPGALGYTGNGQNIAYGNNDISTASGPGSAILNSLAIELDTHQNSDYSDPNGNHIAVQSCGPNNSSTLTPNSADHNYVCPNGALAKLALQSLPSGLSLSDGLTHTITVNYLPPGTCTSNCNNLSVYFDSTLILQTTVDIAAQLNLTSGSTAYIGFTAATGASVENNDIISWSFSQWPLSPITIIQPLQPAVTNFNYTSDLSAITDYSQSGIPSTSFQGVFMQGTVTAISDQQFSDLVNNTPFQGSSCQRQDTGNGIFKCVTTTDLCTTPTNSQPSGANCLTTTNPVIHVSNTYNIDLSQKPLIAPGYIMGKDNALSCGFSGDNTCKGLVSIFTGISGDITTTSGGTNNFNSILIPILGSVQPSTSVTTSPALNAGWTNGNLTINFSGTEIVPSNNKNPPAQLPTVTSFNYSVAGANVPTPASGTITGSSGSITIPVATEGSTTITYSAVDSSNIIETVVTNTDNTVSSASPTFTFNVDLTKPVISGPTVSPASPVFGNSVIANYSCTDGGSGVVTCGTSQFSPATSNTGNIQTPVDSSVGTHTFTVNAQDAAGNISAPSSVTYTVNKASTTTTITSVSPNPALLGSAVTVSVSVVGSTNVSAPSGPVTVTASTGESCAATAPTGSCTLTFSTAGPRTITASYGGDNNFTGSSTTSSVSVAVGDFSITASPLTQTISSGHQAVYTITLTPIGGLTGSVNLSCSGGPPNTTCSVSPAVDNLQGGAVTSTVTLMASKNVTHGTYTLTFTGSYGNGALVHSTSVGLTVKGQN